MEIYNEYLTDSLARLRTVLDDSGSRPILFVGSGMSRRYLGAPDWIGLLEQLIRLNPNCKFPIAYYAQNTGNDLPKVASAIVEQYQGYAWEKFESDVFPAHLYDTTYTKSIFLKYKAASIFKELTDKLVIEGHPYQYELEKFAALNPHALISTNYDGLLEMIFPTYNVIIGQQVIRRKEATNIGHILKIHGCMTKPEEIVISHEDYGDFNNKQKYLTAKLLTYFMEQPVVFLGYSLSDENIRSILAEISEIVAGDRDEVVNNIWVVEWSKDLISSDYKPATDRTVDLGNGKSIRVNYLLVNSYERLYESLYQPSTTPMDALREFEKNVYNIIKSKTISDLEVDMISIENLTDEGILARILGFKPVAENRQTPEERVTLLGVGTIADAEQLMTMFPMRISDVAPKLGLTNWNYVDQLIKKITRETEFNLKETNNKYHINIGIRQPVHRYSVDAVRLLEIVMNKEDYFVEKDGQEIHANKENKS
jgi:hypothetical protein